MYGSGRGRGGPTKKTPATVQCQKCLKRGHYSYECKANAQERPYVARPSRSQQFFNPKLKPKLTEDTLDAVQKKQGIADEELAKKEAERAKKRELEELEDLALKDSPPKRRRSASHGSVASISTRSRSPPPKREARQPSKDRFEGSRELPPRGPSPRSRSFDSRSDYSRRRSESLGGDYHRRSPIRQSPSPRRDDRDSYDRRSIESPVRGSREHRPARRLQSRSPSRSPSQSPERDDGQRRHLDDRGYRQRDDRSPDRRGRRPGWRDDRRGPPPRQQPPEPPRERSLSPFSKRLALTQSMNR
ncbi:hypothetical protein GQ53DRAFT_103922 [Thozetella sp. PMI_491]|nr:hypothetical protein GQ53DRAFT_103922 [Thozetella sp. PMI_491]